MSRLLLLLALGPACVDLDAPPDVATTTDASGTGDAPAVAVDYHLPLACGQTVRVGQGNASDFSHTGLATYAFDLNVALDTPILAMAAGAVLYTHAATGPGDPCWAGGDEACQPYANLVVLGHADGAATLYKHLSTVAVAVGDVVARGDVLGGSGSTGWSTRPHVHVARQSDCGADLCQTIPLAFVEAGVPHTGDIVTSANCRQ